MLISPSKYHNPNHTIRVAVTMIFTANLQLFSSEIPAKQSLAQVLLLTVNNEKFPTVKLNSQFHLNLFYYFSSWFQITESQPWKILAVKLNSQFHMNLFYYFSLWFKIK